MDGTELGYFSLLEKIGEGGRGRVYKARDKRLERRVVIKLLAEARLTDGSPIAPINSPRKLRDLARQMALAHAASFTRRDLKPDNILIARPQTPHQH